MAGAGDISKTITSLDDLMNKLRRDHELLSRMSATLGKSFDELSNTASDHLNKKLRDAAKQSGLLTDEQLKLIKNTRDLVKAVDLQEESLGKALKLQKEYLKVLEKNKKLADEGNGHAAQRIANAKKIYDAELAQLKLTGEQVDALKDSVEKFKGLSGKATQGAKNLDHFSKHIDLATKGISGWWKATLSMTAAFELLKKGVTQGYDEFIKITNVGLQGTFFEVNKQALNLKMTFDQFSEVISKNRTAINALGGGVQGIQKFGDMIKESSKELDYMGRDGIMATARFSEALTKTGANIKDVEGFKKSLNATQKQFKTFNALYGDSADQYASLMEAQMSEDSITMRLIAGGKASYNVLQKEIMARTENYKALGMSNDQIVEFNQKLKDLYDPHKNNQVERIQQANFAKSYFAELQRMNPQDQKQFQAMQVEMDKLAELTTSGADEKTIADFMSKSGLGKFLQKEDAQTQSRRQAAIKAGDQTQQFSTYNLEMFRQMSGGIINPLMEVGKAANLQAARGVPTDTQSPEYQQMKKTALEIATNRTEEGKVISQTIEHMRDLRDVVQRVSSALENSLAKIVLGGLLAAGTILMGGFGGLTGAAHAAAIALGKIAEGVGIPGIGGKGVGKKVFGMGGKAAGMLTGAAGLAAGAGIGTAIESYGKTYENLGEGSGSFAKDLGARTLGVMGDLGNNLTFGLAGKLGEKIADMTAPKGPDMTKAKPKITGAQAPGATRGAVNGQGGRQQLLDLIGKNESGGNYNKLVGGSELNLEDMTITEVLALQTKMRRQPGRFSSTAVGKYQVIQKTLMSAVKALNLNPDTTKFNKDTQDKIANWLVDQRVAEAGRTGTSVQTALSKEWASLPKDASGAGYYDGQNGNKALASYKDLTAAVAGIGTASSVTPTLASNQGTQITPPDVGSAVVPTAAPADATAAGSIVPTVAKMDETNGELKKQTALLTAIAQNTINSKRGSGGYKEDVATVLNRM